MKNPDEIKWTLIELYEKNDTWEVDLELERDTVAQLQQMITDPTNEFTEEDITVWKREIDRYTEIDDVSILDALDNLRFYIEQPDEYRRVNDWRF